KIETATFDCANDSFPCHDREHKAADKPKELVDEHGDHNEKEKDVSDCLPWFKDQGETKLLEKYENSFLCFDFLSEITPACDELTYYEPVKPSSSVLVSQVLEEYSPETEQSIVIQSEVLEHQKSLEPE